MKYLIIFSVLSISAITPSAKGLIAMMFPGVLSSILLACAPTATILFVPFSTAITDGSSITIPLSLTYIRVLQVPKSIPISVENLSKKAIQSSQLFFYLFDIFCRAPG